MPSGGKRPGAGRPRKALTARIDEGIGVVKHSKPKVLGYPENPGDEEIKISKNQKSKPAALPTFLEMSSKEGDDSLPSATDIYAQTLAWVTDAGCERFVTKQLIEDFAFTRRSYLESEYMCKKLGRVVRDGNAVKPSPYVKHSLEYLKSTTALYREIQSIIAQNSTKDYDGNTGRDNAFLQLLANWGF
jgi:hypothetical protein